MLDKVLEAFDTALDNAEMTDAHQKTARKLVGQVDALIASADALPEGLTLTLPSDEEVAALKALTGSIVSPELQALKSKVEAAITLGADAGLVEFDEEAARALVERYNKLVSSVGTKRASGTGRKAAGLRALAYPMRLVIGDGEGTRISGNRTGGGDWTWVRWQITDHAKDHGDVATADLNALRQLVADVENGSSDGFEASVEAADGFTYQVTYPFLG